MTETTHAPWSDEQVAALNAFQQAGAMHSFTCGALHDSGLSPVLEATPSGWICPDPACEYTQDWAHAFMAAESAVPSAPADADLRRQLASSERIRENADFHLGQEMARRQLAEKETGRLQAVVARLRQMTDHWEQQLPEVIRTPAVVSAIRAVLEAADEPSRMAGEAQQPEICELPHLTIAEEDACEQHRLGDEAQQPETQARPAAYQTCGVCKSGYPTGGSCGTCAFNARMAAGARQADTAGEQPAT